VNAHEPRAAHEAHPQSLTARTVWLVAIALGFWALAIGLVAVFVVLGVWIGRYAPEYFLAAVASWTLAGGLVIGLVPRGLFKKEHAALPRTLNAHPRLRAFVKDVAERAGGKEPDSLYLLHEANAFAGRRRPRPFAKEESVIGIGLPLFALLTENELRSVLAHEMGHHLAADVKLGPWVYRTRRAIARAADRFEGSSFWLHLPFFAYAELFMRTSLRISRAQELSADARAAKVAGAGATASALRKIEILGAAWQAYFHSEVLPVVEQKRLPLLLGGFESYWRAAQTPDTPAFALLAGAIEAGKGSSAEDTHPSLEERLAALGDPAPESDHAAPALALLDRIPEAEDGVLRDLLRDAATVLTPVSWDVVGDEVWLPHWRAAMKEAPLLEKLAVTDLAKSMKDWERIAQGTRRGPALASPEAERRRITRLLAIWFAVKLADAGFRIVAAPGRVVVAERGEERLEPFRLVEKVGRGEIDAKGWGELCEGRGLG
jgi:Zn-dependent protease with chaperone function